MKWKLPASVKIAELGTRFRRGKSGAATIDVCNPSLLNLRQHLSQRSQFGVQQLDENSSQQEIESAESDKRGRIVKHSAGIFFGDAAFLDQALIHKITESSALLSGLQNYVQRFAAFEFSNFNLAEHGLKHARDVGHID